MRLLVILILLGEFGIFSRAQGTIDFMNRNIPGANGAQSYNVPFFLPGQPGVGSGMYPGGVTFGLFEAGATVPLVTTQLRTDTPANAAFFAIATQTATTSSGPGTTPVLFVRAWATSAGSFAAAKAGAGPWDEWSFRSQPLGGTPLGGGLPVPTPGMTGWGPPPNGYAEFPRIPEPSTIFLCVLGGGLILVRSRKQ